MDNISKALQKIMNRFKEENGDDTKLEDGDSIHGIFKDGIVKISLDEEKINVEVTLGEPYLFDENLMELEQKEE